MNREEIIVDIQKDWDENPYLENAKRTYSVADVAHLSGLLNRAYAYARLGSERLWNILKEGSKTNGVVRLSLITIIFTLAIAISGCYAQKGTALQYQDNQSDIYNDEEGVEQEDQEEETKQYQQTAEQGDASAQDNQSDKYKEIIYIYTSSRGGYIICDDEEVKKLRNIRLSQIENEEILDSADPSVIETIENCIFRDTKVIFKRLANEYNLPARNIMVYDEDGEEPCPSRPEEKCRRANVSPLKYIESMYLDNDGIWYENVFIEIGASFELP